MVIWPLTVPSLYGDVYCSYFWHCDLHNLHLTSLWEVLSFGDWTYCHLWLLSHLTLFGIAFPLMTLTILFIYPLSGTWHFLEFPVLQYQFMEPLLMSFMFTLIVTSGQSSLGHLGFNCFWLYLADRSSILDFCPALNQCPEVRMRLFFTTSKLSSCGLFNIWNRSNTISIG